VDETAVFSGRLGVTVFGVLFTRLFYALCRTLGDYITRRIRQRPLPPASEGTTEHTPAA
jgi:HAE1 family hydrophobic/amphiphilic exporter-1